MSAACGARQVRTRIHPIQVDHKIPILFVNRWCFWWVFAREKLRQGFFLYHVDFVLVCIWIKPEGQGWRWYAYLLSLTEVSAAIDGRFVVLLLIWFFQRWFHLFRFLNRHIQLRNCYFYLWLSQNFRIYDILPIYLFLLGLYFFKLDFRVGKISGFGRASIYHFVLVCVFLKLKFNDEFFIIGNSPKFDKFVKIRNFKFYLLFGVDIAFLISFNHILIFFKNKYIFMFFKN